MCKFTIMLFFLLFLLKIDVGVLYSYSTNALLTETVTTIYVVIAFFIHNRL